MMSSTQYPITPTIISVSQKENLQNNAEEFQQKSLNSFNIRLFDEDTSTDDQHMWYDNKSNKCHTQNIQICGSIADCFDASNKKSKISIAYNNNSENDDDDDDQHISSDGEKLKRSLVSFQPSSESDENFSDESQHRHILKIQISPTSAVVKAKAETRNTSSSEIVDKSQLNKSSSIIVNSNRKNKSKSKKMSVVSGNRCENDSIYKNVTIIRNSNNDDNELDDDLKDEYDIENLSDDQKLVLNGHHITVKCGSGSAKINNKLIRNKTEIIQLTNGHSGSGNIMNIVNSNNSNGIILSSGQCSPEECISVNGEDHLDSGTCSDVEVNGLTCGSYGLITTSMSLSSPPPLPPKGLKKIAKLSESTCSDASSASSSDSMQYQHQQIDDQLKSPDLIRSIENSTKFNQSIKNTENDMISGLLPTTLLHDIRNHSMKAFLQLSLIHGEDDDDDSEHDLVLQYNSGDLNYSEIDFSNEKSEEVKEEVVIKEHFAENYKNKTIVDFFEDDKFYKFHLNENSASEDDSKAATHEESDESFAGYKDLRSGTSTIRSAKGTIRGVKNRVRNGIATFLQMQQSTIKNFKEKDGGKIVLYTTSMGVVRSTYAKCQAMKQILRTLMVKFEERDVFMCFNHQKEIRERMQSDDIDVPQLFVDGHYIGNADHVERLNETGELRIMLKPFKSRDSLATCNMCGGYKMLPCTSCGGSKKSIHRNHFTAEFIALKCMNCDEVGLVKCYNCA